MKKKMNWFSYWLANVKWKYAVHLADKAHKNTNERYFVMPYKKKLIILNRKQFRRLKDKRFMYRGVYVKDVIKECFYFTPDRGGNYFSTEGKNDAQMDATERDAKIAAIKEAKRKMWIEYRFK